MTHKKCSPGRIHVLLLLAIALALALPAAAEWKEKVLYSFQGGANDGSVPAGGVVFDTHGNLYGKSRVGKGVWIVYETRPRRSKPLVDTVALRCLKSRSLNTSCLRLHDFKNHWTLKV
jgi:hypothetical protein